jgi:4-hydroxybenzoyl-CoA reductase subunit beta
MRLPNFDFREPSTLEEALSILEDSHGNVRLLAGGTDLIPLMKYGLKSPAVVVSLKNITGLKGIQVKGKELYIGAMTPLADLFYSSVIRERFPGLHQAVEAIAAPPIWNVATVGGNICQNNRCLYYNQSKTWRLERPPCAKAGGTVCHAVPKGKKCFSVYSGDLAPALMALGGMVSVEGKGESRTASVQSLFTGIGLVPFSLKRGQIVTNIILPLPTKNSSSGYAKIRMRSAVDYPLVFAAASVTLGKGKKIKEVRLVIGAAGPAPVFGKADQLFTGRTVDEVDFDAVGESLRKETRMVDNLALPGSYRRKMVPVVAKRAIGAALESIA